MHLWIDGYNFLFRLIPQSADLKKNREDLIQNLVEFVEQLRQEVTVIFDAQYQDSGILRKHQGELEIIYTARGQIADDLIVGKFGHLKNPKENLLITSDQKLAWRARQCGVKTQSVEEFLLWYNKKRYLRKPHTLQKIKKNDVVTKPLIPGSIEYYLEKFQDQIEKTAAKETPLSDYERWLKAFQGDEE